MGNAAVEIKLQEIDKLARKLNEFVLSGGDKAGLLNSLGKFIEEQQIKERIEITKRDPDNKKWDPWKESTEKYLREYKPESSLLMREGLLLMSIEHQLTGNDSVLVGSTREYAEYLQEGTKKMAARKFLGFGTDDITELQDAVDEFMKERVA
ncbi:MAG: phage virion morphogenesis protein [Treponema sp.]|jgi:phage gpG-like protein|nr:phage virion morphogenesis protein [Treponema sp.]